MDRLRGMEEASSEPLPFHRVLVVEDDRALLELLTEYLELRGVEVTAVQTGPAALEALAADPFDAVVLDLRIPGLPGDQVLTRIRADPRLAQLPVAVMTGMRPGEFELVAHPDAVLSKPFDIETLSAALRDIAHAGRGNP